jgi:recombination protein RecR
MIYHAKPVANLIAALNRLPGVGPKTAQRLAFHLLAVSREEAVNLAEAIVEAKDKVRHCSVCGDLTEEDPCFLCRSENRDRSILCVVESPKDVVALEKTREFKGLYHVLGGVISPMDGIGPEDLTHPGTLAQAEARGRSRKWSSPPIPTWKGKPPPCIWLNSCSPWE